MSRGCVDYPYDYDASLRHSRFSGEKTIHPHPSMVGSLSMMLPQFGPRVVQPAVASSGFGPAAGVMETGRAPYFIDHSAYTLPKVKG